MKLFLSTDTVGGVWDYTLALVRELRRREHQVLLAVLGEPSEEHLAALPEGVEAVWRPYRLEWMPGAAEDIAPAGRWLSEVARLWGAEVVHLNQMAYSTHPYGAPTVVAVHSDVLSWFGEALGCEAPPEWEQYATWARHGILAADVVVTPSAYQSDLALRSYGRAADRVIHNGVRPTPDEPEPRRESRLLSVGRAWDDAKGMRVYDEAVGLLGREAPPARLLGELEGPHGQRFRAEHVHAPGRAGRAEVNREMRRATVYVGASLYEPFGLAPLEAALHGCALVLSDIPSFRELWEGCALFFPRGDARALADALASLNADADRRAALAEAARTRALRRYTAERFVEEYLELYRAVASGALPLARSG